MSGLIAFILFSGFGAFIIYTRYDRERSYENAVKDAPTGDRLEEGVNRIGAYLFGAFCIFVGVVALMSVLN